MTTLMPSFIPLRKAVEITGLHPNTLRKYADRGDIKSFRLPNGDRRFDVSSFVDQTSTTVCYARVTNSKQKMELRRQCRALQKACPKTKPLVDVGSAQDLSRENFMEIMDRALGGEKIALVVTDREVLAKSGYKLAEQIIARAGGHIIVLKRDVASTPKNQETKN